MFASQHSTAAIFIIINLYPLRITFMSDDLKNLYKQAGLLARYFDREIPNDLYRGQSRTETKQGLPVIYPNPGFVRKDGKQRPPDVRIFDRDGKKFVAGCRCIQGENRGVSVFDQVTPALPGFRWFKLPKGTDIPSALAVTQDANQMDRPNHYTIAPKDDMPLELFLVWLNALNQHLKEEA